MAQSSQIKKLRLITKQIYLRHKTPLLFHGWHHINFVSHHARRFAPALKANRFLSESAALVHDLNYVVKVNSEPIVGRNLRQQALLKAEYTTNQIDDIEQIIDQSHTAHRTAKISKEAMALSDADTLFKALPITPILFASKYISQNKVDIQKLATKVVKEQRPLLAKNIYFYSAEAKRKYVKWAKINLSLWESVLESLNDASVQELLLDAKRLQVL